MGKTVLILGAHGRFGHHATVAFNSAGWTVRSFDRSRDNLMQAAQGVQVIVAGWNPAYPDWASQLPGLHKQIRQAALAADATVILPGNLYVFGAETPAPWGEDSPHRAQNPLGRIRVELEAAYRRDGVRTILLRAGDFLDTRASGNWFDRMMAPSLAKDKLTYPGRTDADHAWAYLPDLTRAAVQLAEARQGLARFEDIPFPGYTLTGAQMAGHLSAALGRAISVKQMAWWPLSFARLVMPVAKHLLEMRYLWNVPHQLDGSKFERLLPNFQHTPVAHALATAASPVLAGKAKPSGMTAEA